MVVDGEDSELKAREHTDLVEHARQMVFDGAFLHRQAFGDLFVRLASATPATMSARAVSAESWHRSNGEQWQGACATDLRVRSVSRAR